MLSIGPGLGDGETMAMQLWGRGVAAWLVAIVVFGAGPAWAQKGAALEGTRWAIVEVYGEPLPQEDTPHIVFEERNRVSGRTACNWFHGTYSMERDAIVILTRLTTLRGCVIGGRRQRDATLEALDSTQAYDVSESVLILSDAGGEPVARLARRGDE